MIWPLSLIQEIRQYNQDKKFVNNHYFSIFSEKIDWKNPKTFNEKIQVFKISKEAEMLWPYVDKVEVRKYIKKTIGEEYLIPIIGIYNNANEINFDKLPKKFVLKTNHGSGWNIICNDKSSLDWFKERENVNEWLSKNFYSDYWRERVYKLIKPKLIIEEYIGPENSNPVDYKFYCFNGKPLFLRTFKDREKNIKKNTFDINWKPLNFSIDKPNSKTIIEKPSKLKEMVTISQKLSKYFKFVRVDLYCIKNKIYFGELTFTPANGLNKFIPNKYDLYYGKEYHL